MPLPDGWTNWSFEHPVARVYTSQTQQGKDIVNLIRMTLDTVEVEPRVQPSGTAGPAA